MRNSEGNRARSPDTLLDDLQSRAKAAKVVKLRTQLNAYRLREARALLLEENGIYHIDGTTSQEDIAIHMTRLLSWAHRYPGRPLDIRLDALDGEIIPAFGMHDVLCEIEETHPLTMTVEGVAQLAPAMLLHAATRRRMSRNSTLELKVPTTSVVVENPPGIQKREREVTRIYDEMLHLLTQRSGKRLTRSKLRKMIGDHGVLIRPERAYTLGMIDEIV